MKKGLGRGLESLFSIYEEDEEPKQTIQKEESVKVQPSGDGVKELDMKLVDPNKSQPRKYFEPNALKELSESIKIHGIIQPIVVNEEKNGRFTIIAGERRFRASLIAGKTTIPAIIKHYDEKQVKEVSLVENLQREDLNPIEAAKAIQVLMDEYVANLQEKNVKFEIARMKGLGEMDAEELNETTMDIEKRVLRKITVEDARLADVVFSELMGDEVELRRKFIEENAKFVKNLDI